MSARGLLTGLAAIVLSATSALAELGDATSTQERAYKLLSTNKTSTMEKELNETSAMGFRFEGVMGGETGIGGTEIVVIMGRGKETPTDSYEYKLLATNKTSTMQKEMSEAAGAGYEYRGQTLTETMFGGKEIVVIMERLKGSSAPRFEYKLLATNKTSTMQKELSEVAEVGYAFRAVSVGSTAFGGQEVVVITQRDLRR